MADINSTESKIEKSRLFNKQMIKKGVITFVTISIIALTGFFLYTNTGKTIEVWQKIELKYIFLCMALMLLDLIIGGWRNHIFVKEFSPGTSHWVAFKANLANIFMGAVTPSQSGGGLAQFYVFHKNGVKLPDAITISFINWVSTILFLPLSGLFAYQIISEKIPEGFISQLAKFGFSIFGTLFIVVIVALFSPKTIGWLIFKLSTLVGSLNSKWKDKLRAFGEKAKTSMVDYRNKCAKLLSKKPQLVLYSFLITIILYFNKFLIAYFIVIAFGVEADFLVIIAIQALVFLLLYFAPSPGASGIAEISLGGLMAGILSEDYLASFILMHRSFLIFLPALIGAFVVIREINKD